VCFEQKYDDYNNNNNDDSVEDKVHIFGSFVLSNCGVVWRRLIANVMSYFYLLWCIYMYVGEVPLAVIVRLVN